MQTYRFETVKKLKSSSLYEIGTELLQNSNIIFKKHLHIFGFNSFQKSNFLGLRILTELRGLRTSTWAQESVKVRK